MTAILVRPRCGEHVSPCHLSGATHEWTVWARRHSITILSIYIVKTLPWSLIQCCVCEVHVNVKASLIITRRLNTLWWHTLLWHICLQSNGILIQFMLYNGCWEQSHTENFYRRIVALGLIFVSQVCNNLISTTNVHMFWYFVIPLSTDALAPSGASQSAAAVIGTRPLWFYGDRFPRTFFTKRNCLKRYGLGARISHSVYIKLYGILFVIGTMIM